VRRRFTPFSALNPRKAVDAVVHRLVHSHQIHAAIAARDGHGTRIIKGVAMTEQQERNRMTREREEIAARVAVFKATQEKFQRDREEYYEATMEAARAVRWNKNVGGALRR
jgi:hypothetical protein